MTADHTTPTSTRDTDNPEERQLLRERAKVLGITHSPNISNALLKERIRAKLGEAGPEDSEPEEPKDPSDDSEPGYEPNPFKDQEEPSLMAMDQVDQSEVARRLKAVGLKPVSNKPLTKKQQIQAEREKQWAEQLRLVRLRITNLNPLKKDLKGEVFSVSNRFVGTVRKFIPYGEVTDNGYHVPFILYQELLGRQFQQINTKKVGQTSLPEHRLVREFAIEVLPDLTPDELAALGREQKIAANQ